MTRCRPTSPVLLDVADRVATVTLNRPEARNALSSELLRLLRQLLSEADADPDVDVIILTGADPAFCAGLDLKELGSTAGNLDRDRQPEDRRTPTAREGRSPGSPSRSSAPSTASPSPAGSSWPSTATSSSPPSGPSSATPTPASG